MEVTINNSETKPLLPKGAEVSNVEVIHQVLPRWLALTSVMIVAMLHLLSYLLSIYVMNQYSYYAYFKQKFPNSSFRSTGSSSPCGNNTNTTEYRQQIVIQKLTSEWNIYCTLASNVPGIFFAINLASYSDVYGRRLFFIAPLLGTLLKGLMCSVGIYFSLNINLFILFYAIEGCTGHWISTLSMVYSYIADITEAGKPRSFIIGVLEGGFGIGALISTILSGYLIKWTNGYFYPEVTSVGIIFLALVLVVFFLPESLPASKRHNKVSCVQNMVRVTECYRSNFSLTGKRWMFITLIFVFIMSAFANLGRLQVETLYQLNYPFCWDSVRIGWYGALKLSMLSMGGLVIIKLFHCFTTDEFIALAGCATSIASCIVTGLATTNFMLYLSAVVGIGSSVTMPIVRSIMSRLAPAHKQGSVFSGIAAVEIICNMASTLGANAVYDATVDIYRGFTFFIMAGYAAVGIFLCLVLIIGQPDRTQCEGVTVNVEPNTDEPKLH